MLASVVLLAMMQQPVVTDTTLTVTSGTRLEAFASAGTIDVAVWDRSAVRIVARAERGSRVDVQLEGSVLHVSAHAPNSGIDLVAYEITVPRHMDLTLGRGDVDISLHGVEGAVDARISGGKILVEGSGGPLVLQSLQGPIDLRNARGRVTAKSSQSPVTLTDVAGDIEVESTSQHVTLTRVDSHNLRATSIGGVIRFSGPLHPDGRYVLNAHSGSIFVRAPGPINATVNVATVGGGFSSSLPFTVSDQRRKGIFIARFGSGSAQVTMESFSGGLVVEEM